MLRHSALRQSRSRLTICAVLKPVIERLAGRYSADQLARFHAEFVTNAAKAEGYIWIFPVFSTSTKIYRKFCPESMSGHLNGKQLFIFIGEQSGTGRWHSRVYHHSIYYVNDKLHIGHAHTTLACDVLARFKR